MLDFFLFNLFFCFLIYLFYLIYRLHCFKNKKMFLKEVMIVPIAILLILDILIGSFWVFDRVSVKGFEIECKDAVQDLNFVSIYQEILEKTDPNGNLFFLENSKMQIIFTKTGKIEQFWFDILFEKDNKTRKYQCYYDTLDSKLKFTGGRYIGIGKKKHDASPYFGLLNRIDGKKNQSELGHAIFDYPSGGKIQINMRYYAKQQIQEISSINLSGEITPITKVQVTKSHILLQIFQKNTTNYKMELERSYIINE